MVACVVAVEVVDDFLEEASGDEAFGAAFADATAAEIVDFVVVDLSGGRAVGGDNVVGVDVELWA